MAAIAPPFLTLVTFYARSGYSDRVLAALCRYAEEKHRTSDVIIRVDVLQSRDDPNICITVVIHTAKTEKFDYVGLIEPDLLQTDNSTLVLSFERSIYPEISANFYQFAPRGHSITPSLLTFLVHFYIKPEHVEAFRDILVEEIKMVLELEPDNIRFDLLQSADDPSRWLVYEILADEAALQHHARMPHYRKVKEALIDMQAKPRSHDKGYDVIFPPCSPTTTIISKGTDSTNSLV